MQGFEKHFYGKRVPGEINLIIEKENQALAKEIEDHQNQNLITQMKQIYNNQYGDYKKDFSPTNQQQLVIKCFAAFLWSKKENEILKKHILADAYNQVCKSDFN